MSTSFTSLAVRFYYKIIQQNVRPFAPGLEQSSSLECSIPNPIIVMKDNMVYSITFNKMNMRLGAAVISSPLSKERH